MNADTIVRNEDIFHLPPTAVSAASVVDKLEELQEEIGAAPPPLSAEELGYRLFQRAVNGTLPSPAELADLAATTAQDSRRAYDALATAVHHAREAFERAVRAGAAGYMDDLQTAWAALLAEVKAAGDLPATPEEAVRRNDVAGYQRLQSLVTRADRIRSLHQQLLGDVPMPARAFTDTRVPPAASELRFVDQRVLTPGGPTDPGARLKFLAAQEPFLAASAQVANKMFEEWRYSLTNIPMVDGPRPTVKLGERFERPGGR